jgi:hypothetical protein
MPLPMMVDFSVLTCSAVRVHRFAEHGVAVHVGVEGSSHTQCETSKQDRGCSS